MSARCQSIVGVNDDDRLPFPRRIECGDEAIANVEPGRASEWCACSRHADEAERAGCNVERWS